MILRLAKTEEDQLCTYKIFQGNGYQLLVHIKAFIMSGPEPEEIICSSASLGSVRKASYELAIDTGIAKDHEPSSIG